MDQDKKHFASWWFWVLMLIVITSVILGMTGTFGKIFGVMVEREVLVRSHQYKEARNSEMATYEAQIAELEGQLNRSDLSEGEKAKIEGQITSINILLRTARSK